MGRFRTACGLAAVAAAVAVSAPPAFGADSIYWSTGSSIRVGALGGGAAASTLFTGESGSIGVAIDPTAGTIFWADSNTGAIRVGNLDGSGTASTLFAGEYHPYGVAIDPALGKIYWTSDLGAIRVANLDGTGSPQDLFADANDPRYLTLDPSAGKLYWIDTNTGAIRVGNLDGSGSPTTLFTDANNPVGLAFDSASGKLYWSDFNSGAIEVASAAGTGSPQNLFTGETYPFGVALDPTAGKIYWADYMPAGIRVANLDGTGSPKDLYTGEAIAYMPAILQAPAGTGVPQLSGGSSAGSTLTCSQGSWALDLLGAFLYRAPESLAYQWTLNGSAIAGATTSSYTASTAGSYTCRVTATNQAGNSTQTSAPHAVTSPSPPPAPPSLTHVIQSHRRWREGNKLAVIASERRPPVGTTVSFTLDEQAHVGFAFTQRVPGRRTKGHCMPQTSKNRVNPKCARQVTRGKLSYTLGAGAHKLRFQGRLSRHEKLPPGRYKLVVTATNAFGQRTTKTLKGTIVAG